MHQVCRHTPPADGASRRLLLCSAAAAHPSHGWAVGVPGCTPCAAMRTRGHRARNGPGGIGIGRQRPHVGLGLTTTGQLSRRPHHLGPLAGAEHGVGCSEPPLNRPRGRAHSRVTQACTTGRGGSDAAPRVCTSADGRTRRGPPLGHSPPPSCRVRPAFHRIHTRSRGSCLGRGKGAGGRSGPRRPAAGDPQL